MRHPRWKCMLGFGFLCCSEHGIQLDVQMQKQTLRFAVVFPRSAGRHVPRCMFVDLELTAIDEVRRSLPSAIPQKHLISVTEGAANKFVHGAYTIGIKLVVSVRQKLYQALAVALPSDSSCPSITTGRPRLVLPHWPTFGSL